MSFSELPCLLVEEFAVVAPLVGDIQLQGVVSVGRLEEGDEGLDEELGVLRGDPVVLDGLRADLTRVLLDVRVVDLRQELYLRTLERVLVSEVHVYVEVAAVVGRLLLKIIFALTGPIMVMSQLLGASSISTALTPSKPAPFSSVSSFKRVTHRFLPC